MNIWKKYFDLENELRGIENIPTDELNVHICRFFMQPKIDWDLGKAVCFVDLFPEAVKVSRGFEVFYFIPRVKEKKK